MNKRFARTITKAFGAAVLAGLALAGGSSYTNPPPPLLPDFSTPPAVAPIVPGATDGPITPIRLDAPNTRYQDDLDASVPGTGIALGGDSVPGYPQIHLPGKYDGDNPLKVPENSRPLPTGTAIGPHGENYAFYGIVFRIPNGGYIVPDTVVVDLAHPGKALFTLQGISQASGAYDAQSGRMIVLGNTKDGHRALWQSDPISQNPAWYSTLKPLGTFSGPMNGNRESQIVALPNKSGFLVVGAGDVPYTQPIQAVTASTPQGLLTAKPTALISPQTLPQVYGPTITNIQEINGKAVISLRVSTYGTVGPPGIDHYDPHTWTTTFGITPTLQIVPAQQASAPLAGPAVIPKLTGFGS